MLTVFWHKTASTKSPIVPVCLFVFVLSLPLGAMPRISDEFIHSAYEQMRKASVKMWRRQQRKNRATQWQGAHNRVNPVNPRKFQGFWNETSSLQHHMYMEHKAVKWETGDAVADHAMAWCPRGSSFSDPVIYTRKYHRFERYPF